MSLIAPSCSANDERRHRALRQHPRRDRAEDEVDDLAVAMRAHHDEIELALLRPRRDRLGDVADRVLERRLEALLREEGADRPKHAFGLLLVVVANGVTADEAGGALRD